MYGYNDYKEEEVSVSRTERSTPSTGRKTPGSKTPKPDRFIPSHDTNFELSHFNITKENSHPNTEFSPSKLTYTNALEDSIFDGKTQSKILAFKAKAPVPKNHLNSLRVLYSQNKENSSQVKKPQRHIPQVPERILDAPDFVDDYYLNLLDWNASNVLAVALGQTVYLWNANTSEITSLLTLPETDNNVTSVSWMKEGGYLAVGTNHCTVQLWDVEKAKRVREMKGHEGRVGSLAWNSHILSSGSRDTNIFNHDVRVANHHISTLSNHTQEVCGLKWSHDGTQLASGGNDNLLNIWNINNPTNEGPQFSLDHHTAAVKALAWCPFQPNLLASGGGTADRSIRFWNTTTGACLNTVDTKSQVCQLLWSTHSKELVSSHGFSQNQLTVWKYPSMVKVAELTGHQQRVLHLALSPDGETVVSGAGDETLRFWKVFEREHKAIARKVSDESVLRSKNIR